MQYYRNLQGNESKKQLKTPRKPKPYMDAPKTKSILVPSVQQLSKDSLSAVPSRFLREDLELHSVSLDLQLPVISLASLLADDNPSQLHNFQHACRDWGFFQVVNHGVSSDLIEKFKVESRDFFEMSVEEKSKYWQKPDDMEGFGQNFVVSEEQKLDWTDSFFLTLFPLHLRRPHLLPLLPLPFRETLERYADELKKLAMKIFDCIAKDLKMDPEYLRGIFEQGKQSMRMGYYPPCPHSDKVIGFSPHSDGSGLTILLQCNEVEGLQIRKDGKWVPIVPLPGAFIVNIGDIMEIVSNGIYSSVEHRVMINPKMERLSAATFFNPRMDSEIGPAPCLVTRDSPARFRTVSVTEYFTNFYARQLKGKSYLDVMRINHK